MKNAIDLKINDCWNRIGVWRTEKERCPELDHVIHCRNCPVFSKTGRKLLRTDPPEGYSSEWTTILAREKPAEQVNIKSAFVFRAGNEWLALPSHMIQEVITMSPIHSIPNIDNEVLRGLVNINGRLQICVSIGRVLRLKKQEKTQEQLDPDYISTERLVVVRQNNQLVAFPVSEVKGTIRYSTEMIKDLPVTISGSKAAYTMGIINMDNLEIGILKDKPLFKTLTKDLE